MVEAVVLYLSLYVFFAQYLLQKSVVLSTTAELPLLLPAFSHTLFLTFQIVSCRFAGRNTDKERCVLTWKSTKRLFGLLVGKNGVDDFEARCCLLCTFVL